MRCPAPPTPQARAEKQKSLLPCHPPSTLGSRPPAAGASPVTHTRVFIAERCSTARCPVAAQARGSRLRSRPRGLRHQPRGWRPLVDNCCVSLWFVCPTPAERMPAPKEAGRCWGLGSLDEADVGGGPSRAPHHRLNLDTPAHGAGAAVCPAWPQGRVRPEGEWTGRPGRRQPPRGLSPKPRASAQARGSRGDR